VPLCVGLGLFKPIEAAFFFNEIVEASWSRHVDVDWAAAAAAAAANVDRDARARHENSSVVSHKVHPTGQQLQPVVYKHLLHDVAAAQARMLRGELKLRSCRE
jgi:hypothetical protein